MGTSRFSRAYEHVFNVLGFYGIVPPSFDRYLPQTRLALLRTAMILVCSTLHPSFADEMQGRAFSQWLRSFCKKAVKDRGHDTFAYWLDALRRADTEFYYKIKTWRASTL